MDNEKNNIYLTKDDVPELEESTIDIEKVSLSRTWSFWEGYEQKDSNTSWNSNIKKIFSFKDIISFWQFWNHYPGSCFSEVFYNGEYVK